MGQTNGEDMIWALASYKKTGSQELRNQLVVHYLSIVCSAAVQLRAIIESFLGQEDLADQDALALVEYLNRYDPDRSVRFETYAFIWIGGSTIGYIRSQDWAPHWARSFQKRINRASSVLSHKETRGPDVKKVARYLGLPVEKVEDHIKYMNHAAVLSSESVLQDMTVIFTKGELEAGDVDGKPKGSLYYRRLMEMLTTITNGLGEEE